MTDTSHLKLLPPGGSERRFWFPGGTPDGSNEHWRRVYMDTFMIFVLGIDNQIIGYNRATAAVEVFQDLARERYRERDSDSVEMQIDQQTWNTLFSDFRGSVPTFPWKIPDYQILSPSSSIAYQAWRQVLGLPCEVVQDIVPKESELITRILATTTIEEGREILQATGHGRYFMGLGGDIRDKRLWHRAWLQAKINSAMMSSNNRSNSTPKPSVKNPFALVSSPPSVAEKRKIWPKDEESNAVFKIPKTSASTTKPNPLAPIISLPDTASPVSSASPTATFGFSTINSNPKAEDPGTVQTHHVMGLDGPSVGENTQVGGLFGGLFAPPRSTAASVGGLFAPPASTVASEDANPRVPLFKDGAGTRKLPDFNESQPIHGSLVNCWEDLSKSKYWIKSQLVTGPFEIRLPGAKITNQLLQPDRIVTTRHSDLFQIERRGAKDDDICLGINLSQQFTGELSKEQMDILRDTWKCIVRWVTVVCQGGGIEFTKWCFLWSRNLCFLMMNSASEEEIWAWLEKRESITLRGETDCQFGKEFSLKITEMIDEQKSSDDNEGLLQAVSSAVLAEKGFFGSRNRFLQAVMIAVYSIATSKVETDSFSEAHRLLALIWQGHPVLYAMF